MDWNGADDSLLLHDFRDLLSEYEKGRNVEANDFVDGCLYVHKETGAEIVVVSGRYDYETIMDVFLRVWKLSHPLILPVVGVGDWDGKPFIATSFMRNGDLRTFLERARTSHSEPDSTCKSKCVFGIAAGMALLHSQGIIHRKLRPGTVFLNESFEPVIGLDPSAWEDLYAANQYTIPPKGAYGFLRPQKRILPPRAMFIHSLSFSMSSLQETSIWILVVACRCIQFFIGSGVVPD